MLALYSLCKSRFVLKFVCLLITISLLPLIGIFAQPNTTIPARAFTNVTIHKADGNVLKSGSIVWREGVITDIGKRVDIPFDAMITDGGDSLHIYPGFIDAMSLWASPDQPEKREKAEVAGNPPLKRAGVQPERKPHQMLEISDAIKKAQKAGFTTAAFGLNGEMLPGQLDLFMLNGDATSDYLQNERLGLLAQLVEAADNPGPVYPTSVMGILAKFRQIWFEATALRDHLEFYKNQPEGLAPPNRSEPLEALIPAINNEIPLYFVLDSHINTYRVSNLKEELDFSMIVVSGKEAYKDIEQLKEHNLPILASFDLPEKPAWKKEESGEKKDSDEKEEKEKKGKADVTLDQNLTDDERAHREKQWQAYLDAVNNVKMLVKAGLEPGFASNGLAPDALKKNIKTMLENGLNEEQLLSILTTNTASVLGIEQITGDLEPGNWASFSVFSKPFMHEKANVVFSVSGGNITAFSTDE